MGNQSPPPQVDQQQINANINPLQSKKEKPKDNIFMNKGKNLFESVVTQPKIKQQMNQLKKMNLNYFKDLQNEDILSLTIYIAIIKPPTKKSQYALEKQFSNHKGVLKWKFYQQEQLWKFNLIEDSNYQQLFILQDDGSFLEGNQEIWNVLCPIKTGLKTVKVAEYSCQSSYKTFNQQKNLQISPSLKKMTMDYDIQTIRKWGEQLPQKEEIKNIKKQSKVQQQQMLQYHQINRYFGIKSKQWCYGSQIIENDKQFKGLFIGIDQKQNSYRIQKPMSQILINDIKNREKSYLQLIKRQLYIN